MDETIEWKMFCTLIKRVQKDKTLEQEEKNQRVTKLFDWWEDNGKKFVKLNNKIQRLHAKNKPINFLIILKRLGFIHTLHFTYEGIKKPYLTNFPFKPEDIEQRIEDDLLFFKILYTETIEYERMSGFF